MDTIRFSVLGWTITIAQADNVVWLHRELICRWKHT